MGIHTTELFFEGQFEEENHNLNYLGPTIRGAFGHALRNVVCHAPPKTECNNCRHEATCPYTHIFNGRPPADRTMMRKYPAIPQPFVLHVAPPDSWWGEPRELRFGIRLFGPAVNMSQYIIESMIHIANQGLGPKRTRFTLHTILDGKEGNVIWNKGDDSIVQTNVFSIEPKNEPISNTLQWSFETPVCIRKKGRQVNRIHGIDLVLAGRRRWNILNAFYSAEENTESVDRIEESAFRVLDNNIRPWSIQRYSGRQHRKVPLSGITGKVTIQGPWQQAGNWLHCASDIHLGKHCSFGFGRVSWKQV
ncbi:MAG: CRISPR system precrRNA processing endoribonuclease RAMP protein Cas6 [Phycisphaerales bacterium]|nr:CRISPR system precrRNA processing endoribonuclease RAMP protein Cas6 [Planctomycetota bacterium]MBL6998191.1 CRISPR system precrRNA processing endoribonuclease RAMP protein Cas6 [Phycisphaerales bacterium]